MYARVQPNLVEDLEQDADFDLMESFFTWKTGTKLMDSLGWDEWSGRLES